MLFERRVVAFDWQQVVRAVVLQDLADGLLVGVQRVEHDELAIQRTDRLEQLARGGYLVALVLDLHGAEHAPAGQAHGAHELGSVVRARTQSCVGRACSV